MQEQLNPNAPAPDPDPTPAPAPVNDNQERVEALEAQLGTMAQSIQTLTSALNDAMNTPAPVAPEPAPREPTGDEFLDRLAAQPAATIDERARKAAETMAQQAINPALTQLINTAGKLVLTQKSIELDSRFGAGAYKEEFEPVITKALDQLRKTNPKAVADPDTLQAIIDHTIGQKFDALGPRKETHIKTMADQKTKGIQEIVSAIPQGGGRFQIRPGGAHGDLPEDFDTFAKELTRSTGEPIDRNEFARLYNSGNTIDDFLAAVKPPKGA